MYVTVFSSKIKRGNLLVCMWIRILPQYKWSYATISDLSFQPYQQFRFLWLAGLSRYSKKMRKPISNINCSAGEISNSPLVPRVFYSNVITDALTFEEHDFSRDLSAFCYSQPVTCIFPVTYDGNTYTQWQPWVWIFIASSLSLTALQWKFLVIFDIFALG